MQPADLAYWMKMNSARGNESNLASARNRMYYVFGSGDSDVRLWKRFKRSIDQPGKPYSCAGPVILSR
jgi:hypothetical protein